MLNHCLLDFFLIDQLILEPSETCISPLSETVLPSISEPLVDRIDVCIGSLHIELRRSLLRNLLRVRQGDALTLCSLCPERSLKVLDLRSLGDDDGDLASMVNITCRFDTSVNDLLICFQLATLFGAVLTLHALQHSAGFLKKAFDLVIPDDGLPVLVP